MTNPIGSSDSIPLNPVQEQSIPELSRELRAKLLDLSQNLQDLLNQPGKLGNDEFITQVQQNALALSNLVTKAAQC